MFTRCVQYTKDAEDYFSEDQRGKLFKDMQRIDCKNMKKLLT